MDTERIYTAQLNASKYYNTETITELVNKLREVITNAKSVVYNEKTKTIDVTFIDGDTPESHLVNESKLRSMINYWINEALPISEEDKNILNTYNNCTFNITQINCSSYEYIMAIYLF